MRSLLVILYNEYAYYPYTTDTIVRFPGRLDEQCSCPNKTLAMNDERTVDYGYNGLYISNVGYIGHSSWFKWLKFIAISSLIEEFGYTG